VEVLEPLTGVGGEDKMGVYGGSGRGSKSSSTGGCSKPGLKTCVRRGFWRSAVSLI